MNTQKKSEIVKRAREWIERHPLLFLIALAGILFIPGLGAVHLFDWDEINFAESAREMLLTGNWWQVSIDFHPFWEKPPLFIWLQALSMSIFGINEFAARLPNAITGIATLLLLYRFAESIYDKQFALIWAVFYAATFFPHLYFKSGIIDPLFNLFMLCGIYFLFRINSAPSSNRTKSVLWAGFFIGLAVLTKGPVGVLLPALTAILFFLLYRKAVRLTFREILILALSVLLISSPWYVFATIKNGVWFLEEFISYQLHLASSGDTGHAQPFYYHFIVLLFACFPASVFLFPAFRKKSTESNTEQEYRTWMILLLIVVVVVFSAIRTKIIHYSSLAWFPIVFLAADYFYSIYRKGAEQKPSVGGRMLFLILLFIWALAPPALVLLGNHPEWVMQTVKDPFIRDALQIQINWPYWLCLPAVLLFTGGLFFYKKWMERKAVHALPALWLASILFVQSLAYSIAPRIEAYTQRPAISFYKDMSTKEVYVEVLGFKSYAHLFYALKTPSDNESPYFKAYMDSIRRAENKAPEWPEPREFSAVYRSWLLVGRIDRPAWFVTKSPQYRKWIEEYDLKLDTIRGGFAFLKREARVSR